MKNVSKGTWLRTWIIIRIILKAKPYGWPWPHWKDLWRRHLDSEYSIKLCNHGGRGIMCREVWPIPSKLPGSRVWQTADILMQIYALCLIIWPKKDRLRMLVHRLRGRSRPSGNIHNLGRKRQQRAIHRIIQSRKPTTRTAWRYKAQREIIARPEAPEQLQVGMLNSVISPPVTTRQGNFKVKSSRPSQRAIIWVNPCRAWSITD